MVQDLENNLDVLGLYQDTIRQRDDGTFEADALVSVDGRRRIYRINFRRGQGDEIQIINAEDRNNIVRQNIEDEGRENMRHSPLLNGIFAIYNIIKFLVLVIPFGLFYPQIGDNCSYFSVAIGYLLLLGIALEVYYNSKMYLNIRTNPNWRAGTNLRRIFKISWWVNFITLLMSLTYLFSKPECGNKYDSFIIAYISINFIEGFLPILFVCCAVPLILLFARYVPSGTPLDRSRLDTLPLYKFDPTIIPAQGKSYEIVRDKIGFENEAVAEDAIDLTSYIEGDEIRLLRCKHHFKKETIDEWLKNQSQQCPICRHNQNEPHISEETSVV